MSDEAKNLLYCCPDCGCTDIQETAWIYVNSGECTQDEGPLEELYCPQCEQDTGAGHFKGAADTTIEKPFKPE